VPAPLIGAQMAANCQKSCSPHHVRPEHDVADGKNDAAQEQETSGIVAIGSSDHHCLFAVGYAALRRPELS